MSLKEYFFDKGAFQQIFLDCRGVEFRNDHILFFLLCGNY